MFWILGADALVHALRKLSTAGPVDFLANQLTHKEWAGFAFYDLIFPLFVFIVGVSSVFSLERIVRDKGRGEAVKRILVRAGLLFLFGLFYNGGLSARWGDIRWVGVLQRIAIAYAVTGLLFCYLRPRTLIAATGGLLVGYWALLTFSPMRDIRLETKSLREIIPSEPIPVAPAASPLAAAANGEPSAAPPARRMPPPAMDKVRALYASTATFVSGQFDPGYNVANHFDFRYLPGRGYDRYWDPEGILSTIPAVASCLLGVLAGLILRRSEWDERKKVLGLVAAGLAALAAGYLWGLQFPIIKKIWTSSFVLVAAGWSFLLLALFYYLIDVRGWKKGFLVFVWIGMNPITLYLLTSFINFSALARRFVGGEIQFVLDNRVAKGLGELLVALVSLGILILIARVMYVKRIFLKV